VLPTGIVINAASSEHLRRHRLLLMMVNADYDEDKKVSGDRLQVVT